MTVTETDAFEALLAHHRSLTEGARQRVSALSKAVEGAGRYEPAAADLLAFLAEEVLPHATAEESTIYRAASATGTLAAVVEEMTAEHRRLEALAEELAGSTEGPAALNVARTLGTLFAAHVEFENEVILPGLRASGADLAELVRHMHELVERAKPAGEASPPSAQPTGTEEALVALLLEGAEVLAAGGEGDRACRLVAAAWAVLHGPRPDLAVRLTAALHKLARRASAEPVSFTASRGEGPQADEVLDVRDMAPARRHEVIFATYRRLRPGSGFVLVNDHDPKPLYYQFEAEHAGQFTWEYQEAGPSTWQVRIGRALEPGLGTAPDQ